MKAVARIHISQRERWRQPMHLRVLIGQSQQELSCVRDSGTNPEVDVFRKHRRAVDDARLTADQKVLQPGPLKAAEEFSHRGSSWRFAVGAATSTTASIAERVSARSTVGDKDPERPGRELAVSCVFWPSSNDRNMLQESGR